MICSSSHAERFSDARAKNALASAIIPCKNRIKDLRVALESVRDQGANIEIVVVDDGSDEPLSAQLGFDFPEVIFVRHDASRGAAAARNAGVRAAGGEFVAFLDSDDLWLEGHVARAIACIRAREAAGQAPVMAIAATIRKKDGIDCGTLPNQAKRADRRIGDWLWLDGGFVQTSGFVVRRETALSIPFDAERRTQEDLAWLLALEAAGVDIVSVPEAGAVWNDDARSDRLTLTAKADTWARFASGLPSDWISDEARMACRFAGGFEGLLMGGRYGEAARGVLEAMRVVGVLWVLEWLAGKVFARAKRWFVAWRARGRMRAAEGDDRH